MHPTVPRYGDAAEAAAPRHRWQRPASARDAAREGGGGSSGHRTGSTGNGAERTSINDTHIYTDHGAGGPGR